MQAPIPLSLYVHIPWCVRKCPYCDFNSHQAEGALPEQAYAQMLGADLRYYQQDAGGRQIGTVFFGGGTPSLFSASAIGRILELADHSIGLSADCEITLEANPGTFEQERFRDYRRTGVNRLSIGVQSFQPEALQQLGRIHSSEEAVQAVAMARRAGFDNINLDLMFGLPGQDVDLALHDLRRAIDLQPEHLSWYELTIEPNTVFYNQPPRLPEDDLLADINEAGFALLAAAGYERYEISAFAKPGRRCRHNLNYWQFGDYLGIGAGAHGKLTRADGTLVRTQRNRMPAAYLESGPERGFSYNAVALNHQPFEFLMNALRLTGGVARDSFHRRTQLDSGQINAIITSLTERGFLEPDPEMIKPSALGLRYLNQCLADLLPDDDAIRLVPG